MSQSLEQIEKQVLGLPADKRAQLVEKLWASLGDASYPVVSEEWKIEIERRCQELVEGRAKAVPGEAVSR